MCHCGKIITFIHDTWNIFLVKTYNHTCDGCFCVEWERKLVSYIRVLFMVQINSINSIKIYPERCCYTAYYYYLRRRHEDYCGIVCDKMRGPHTTTTTLPRYLSAWEYFACMRYRRIFIFVNLILEMIRELKNMFNKLYAGDLRAELSLNWFIDNNKIIVD